jgi:hypothetical protein
MGLLELDLPMGEAEGRHAGRRMNLVAQPVTSLCGWRSVISQAVSLDDQVEIGPKEVDFETVYPCFG